MSNLLNMTQGIGMMFGKTIIPGTNVSARAAGYGQVLCADTFKLDAASTSVTPGTAASCWANWRDQPAEAGTNVRRMPHQIAGIVLDNQPGGVLDDAHCQVLVEGYVLAWVRRTAANAGVALYDAIGSPLSLEANTTNVVRVLSSGISVVTATGTPGPMKCIGLCETAITSTVATIDAAEGATSLPMQPTGAAGTVYAMSNYQIMLADVLFSGIHPL